MTNKQYLIITDIKSSLSAIMTASGIQFVGEAPDELFTKVGQKFPACIVEDGNETYQMNSGEQYKCTMEVKVHLYTEWITAKTKMKHLLDLQAQINAAILADFTCGGNAANIVLTAVPKDIVEDSAGTQYAHRIIVYSVEFFDSRV